jgi:type IV pilus assembly protein PilA
MNYSSTTLKLSTIKCLVKKEKTSGFTLIELLVVIIIMGALTAIALPSLLAQVGKARESEATINLGSMSRSQQAYHVEKRAFADTLDKLALNGSYESKYYNFAAPTSDDTYVANVKHQAVPKSSTNADYVKNYTMGVYHNNGLFTSAFCRGTDVGQLVDVGVTATDSCTNSGIKVQ